MPQRIKLFLILSFVFILSASYNVQAKPTKSYILTADVTYVTDYMVRGRSINGGTAAIQGHVLYINNNFFLGIWATSLDVGKYEAEIDYYGGYRFVLDKTTNLDVFAQAITVPGLKNFTFWRLNAALGGVYSKLNWKASVAYDPELDNSATQDGDNFYMSLALSYPIQDTAFSLNAGVGYEKGIAVATADQDKFDWYAGLSAKGYGLNWDARYIATDAQDIYDSRVLFSVQKVF